MSDRHEPGALIGIARNSHSVSKGRPLVFTLSFFQTATMKTDGLTLNNKNQGKKAEKRRQLRRFG